MDNRILELAKAGYFIYSEDGKFFVGTSDSSLKWGPWEVYSEAIDWALSYLKEKTRPKDFKVTVRYDRGLGIEYMIFDFHAENQDEAEILARRACEVDSSVVINEIRVRAKV